LDFDVRESYASRAPKRLIGGLLGGESSREARQLIRTVTNGHKLCRREATREQFGVIVAV